MQRSMIRVAAMVLAVLVFLAATPAMTAGQITFVCEIANASPHSIKCVAMLNDATDVAWDITIKPGESETKSASFTPFEGQPYSEFGLEIENSNGSPQLICGFFAGLKNQSGHYEITGVEPQHCMFQSANYTYSFEDGTVYISYTFKGVE